MTEPSPGFVEMMARLVGFLAPVREATAGYAADLVNGGLTHEAASLAAVEFHNHALRLAWKSAGLGKKKEP